MDVLVNSPTTVRVALSRRNLVTLLKMLDLNANAKFGDALARGSTLYRTVNDDGLLLSVTAEEDEVHYGRDDQFGAARLQFPSSLVADILDEQN